MKIQKFIALLVITVFTFSCQDEAVYDMNNDVQLSLDLKKGSTANNTFMVISKSETLPPDLMKEIVSYGEVTKTIPEIGILVVSSADANFSKKVEKLAEVRSVVPDLKVQWLEPMDVKQEVDPLNPGADEYFYELGYLWGLGAIDAPQAWSAGYNGDGVTIAILDSGIDRYHPDLEPNIDMDLSASFVPGETWYVSEGVGSFFNHGSHVAGIAAGADSDWGIIGVAPYANIMAVKVLSEFTGSGAFSWINAGIVYAADHGADVINMSLGATFNKNGMYLDDEGNLQKVPAVVIQELIHAQQRAIDYAYRKGVTIITSAGNDAMNGDGNGSAIVMPADLNNVISVSATGPNDSPAYYSNIGRSLIDVAAPGGDYYYSGSWSSTILSAGGGGSFWWAQGTSMAAPHVAGVAALIIGKNGGKMDPHEVEKQLIKTADKIDTNGNSIYYGKGRVNAYRAVTE